MKALRIDYEFYYYPPEYNNIEAFIDLLNNNYNSFIPLAHLIEDKCKEPYFIKEDVETEYLNIAQIDKINEVDITVLSQNEYMQRLKDVVDSKCVLCENYIDDGRSDNLENHADKISLDGECIFFEEVKHKKDD